MQKLSDATLLPLNRGSLGLVAGGLYDVDGKVVRKWPLLCSSHSTRHFPNKRLQERIALPRIEKAIYGGCWFSGFGHFLTETLPNLASIADSFGPDDPRKIVFHSLHRQDLSEVQAPAQYFLERLAIDRRRLLVVNEPLQVGELAMSMPPHPGRYRYDASVAGILDRTLQFAQRDGTRRIFFSRSGLNERKPRSVHEQALESMFAELGFDVVAPETLSIEQQIEMVNQAKVLAGVNGSAIHWSLLSTSVETVISLGWDLKLQRGICKVRGQGYLSLRGQGLSRFRGRPYRRLPPDYVRRAILASNLPILD